MTVPINVLRDYFDNMGGDNKYQYYNIRSGYMAFHKMETISVVGVSHDGKKYTVHSEERGELEATKSAVQDLDVYMLVKVYPEKE